MCMPNGTFLTCLSYDISDLSATYFLDVFVNEQKTAQEFGLVC
jgi:hypothetical protein